MNEVIVVNPERVLGTVNPGIYGSFIENLGTCIYGGVYDPKSPAADKDGFRQDVMEGARQMGITSVRFPGGCIAPYYHFENGIGPRKARPRTRMRSHYDNPDNSFGTDEYLTWCDKIGAEPFICVNMGTGTAEEARNWVEYCNGEPGSRWADKRVENGRIEPYGVKLWGLGNEIGGKWELGYCDTAYDYIKKAREFAMAMKEADPSIRLIGCGAHFPILDGIYDVPGGRFPNPSDNWNREVLDSMFMYLDFISMHDYIGHDYKDDLTGSWGEMTTEEIHYYLSERMQILEDAYQLLRQDIRLIQHKHSIFKPIGIALDEYNPWYRSDEQVFCPYHTADGLLTGAYFNIFIRNADVALLSNMAQLVNVLPAMVCEPEGTGFYRSSVSLVQEVYKKNKGLEAVDVWTKGETWKGSYYSAVPYLDVSASRDKENGRLILNIVNRNVTNSYTVELKILDSIIKNVSGRVFGNQAIDQVNSFKEPEALKLHVYNNLAELPMISIEPLSVNVLEVIVENRVI